MSSSIGRFSQDVNNMPKNDANKRKRKAKNGQSKKIKFSAEEIEQFEENFLSSAAITCVPTLVANCQKVIAKHFDEFKFKFGDLHVPFKLIEPALFNCSAAQLEIFEFCYEPLFEDTNELWKFHTETRFPGAKFEGTKYWSDIYFRLEQEAKQLQQQSDSDDKTTALLHEPSPAPSPAPSPSPAQPPVPAPPLAPTSVTKSKLERRAVKKVTTAAPLMKKAMRMAGRRL